MIRIENPYAFQAALLDAGGVPAPGATAAVHVDAQPLFELLRFEYLKKRNGGAEALEGRLEPVWSAERKAPFLSALKLKTNGFEAEVSLDSFRAAVQAASKRWVADGHLRNGQQFRYLVSAYEAAPGAFVDESKQDLPEAGTPLRPMLEQSRPVDSANGEHGYPVFISQAVFEETLALARRSPEKETGGLLGGLLCRDPEEGTLFLRITVFVAAEHARGSAAEVAIPPEAFAAARQVLSLRAKGESLLAWVHSHLDWCALNGCGDKAKRTCLLRSLYWSEKDSVAMRAGFAFAGSVALVQKLQDGSVTPALFGWANAGIRRRAFRIEGKES